MGVQSIKECEQRKIEKLLSYKLPNYCKKIGWTLFVVCLVTLLLIKFVDGDFELLKNALKRVLLVSMFIVVLSKEKIEDERIQQIRAKAFSLTFLLTAMYILFQPIANFIVGTIPGEKIGLFDDLGDFVILWMMLVVYLVFYTIIKKK
jgi:hypothetical protein